MALVEKDPVDDSFHRLIDGGVFENDVRALTSEFQGQAFAGSCEFALYPFSNTGRSGESDLGSGGMFHPDTLAAGYPVKSRYPPDSSCSVGARHGGAG